MSSIWGTTEDWAGSGPHKLTHMPYDKCCKDGSLKRVKCRQDDMSIIDKATGDLLEVWQCSICMLVYFRHPSMNSFFRIQPVSDDDFR
jgi:hypothetical protein